MKRKGLSRPIKVTAGKNQNDAWRITLPKSFCRVLGINPGDTVVVILSKIPGLMIVEKAET